MKLMNRPIVILSLLLTCWLSRLSAQDNGFYDCGFDPYVGGSSFTVDLAQLADSEWCFPLPGAKVISPYGQKRRRHSGVDLKTFPRDSIRAAFDGVVIGSGPMWGYGNCVVIRHIYGFRTLYSHNVENFVKAGDEVKAGQVIALTGRTGRATTEHLHFEVRVAARHYDPSILFDYDTQALKPRKISFFKNGKVKIGR